MYCNLNHIKETYYNLHHVKDVYYSDNMSKK